MSATKTIVHNALMDYRKRIFDTVENRCRKFCTELCAEAIRARLTAPGAHNFTGNLLNSIVVCLYREKQPVSACYAAKFVPEAIQVKMTRRRRSYTFKSDYDGAKSRYLPTVQTNGGWGVDDARNFFQNYIPGGNNLFDIVVAYPVEYANWIEMKRATTGILQAYAKAEQVGIMYLKLPRK